MGIYIYIYIYIYIIIYIYMSVTLLMRRIIIIIITCIYVQWVAMVFLVVLREASALMRISRIYIYRQRGH